MNHELKTLPLYYQQIHTGKKRFELRKNDRDFRIDDVLVLKRWHPVEGYADQGVYPPIVCVVTSILREFDGLVPGYCILSFYVKGENQ